MFGKASLFAQAAPFSRTAWWRMLRLIAALSLLAAVPPLAGAVQASTATPAPPATYTIAGRVTPDNVPLYGATIAAGPGYSTEVNSDGTYLLQGLPAGTYTITPTKPSDDIIYAFQPATRTVTVPPNTVNQDFTMTRIVVDYGISGCVTDARGAPLASVTIFVSNGLSVTTGSSGCYGFFASPGATYTLTPTKPGYTFTPAMRSISVPGDTSGQDFAGNGPAPVYMPLVEVACPTFCGAVRIDNGGVCCIGGLPGSTTTIPVSFGAVSAMGTVTSMRTDNENCRSTSLLDQAAWEPFVTRRTYTLTLPVGWSSFAVRAQYRDAVGNVSPVYCAEVTLEGYEPPAPMPSALRHGRVRVLTRVCHWPCDGGGRQLKRPLGCTEATSLPSSTAELWNVTGFHEL